MEAISEIAVDLLRPGMPVIVHAKQNDSATRYIYATLTQNGAPYEIPAGTIGTMRVRKPDGTACFYDSTETAQAVSISGNVVQCLLVDQALTAAGKAECEVNLYNSEGEKLTSFTFALFIQASVLDDAEVVSSSYYNILTQKIAEAQQAASAAASSASAAASSASAAASSAQEAEQSAQDAAASVVDAVKSVNGETPNASGAVTVGGADIQLTGYSMPSSTSPIAAADSVNAGLGKLEAGLADKMDTPTLTSVTVTTLNQATGTITWYRYGKIAVASFYVKISTTNTGNSQLMAAAQYPFDKLPLYMCRQNGMTGSNEQYSITLETTGAINIRNKTANAVCTLSIMYLLAD